MTCKTKPSIWPGLREHDVAWSSVWILEKDFQSLHRILLTLSASSAALIRSHKLDIFETPVTATPQKEMSKTLTSSKIP